MPIVSVIITTYNRQEYLAKAIRSVIDQSYSDTEIIVVDDGSVDQTKQVIDNFHDPRLRYIYQENQGRSIARNNGLHLSTGKYISLLDDDDYYLPEKIEKQVKFLDDHPEVDFVSSGSLVVDENGTDIGNLSPWRQVSRLDLYQCTYACPLVIHGVLLPRKFLDRLESWFDPTLEPAEDKDFFIRMFYAGARMAWLPEILVAYRMHQTNSQRNSERYNRVNRLLLDKIFTLPELPERILLEKDKIYAQVAIKNACQSYAYGQFDLAKQELLTATSSSPALLESDPPKLIFFFSDFAGSIHVRAPMEYIDSIFNNLPERLSGLGKYRKEAKSAYYMKRVFSSPISDKRISLKDWGYGIFYSPHWLRNRGVWSVLLRVISFSKKYSTNTLH